MHRGCGALEITLLTLTWIYTGLFKKNEPISLLKISVKQISSYVLSILLTINIYFLSYKCSIWPPPAAWTTSIKAKRISISRYTELIAVVIRCLRSSSLVGSGGT